MANKFLRNFIKYYPQHIILLLLISTIALGVLLLSLPISQLKYIPFIDILFTSVSITTVTGIITIPLESFSSFGQAIILILMQIGGLGLMTISLLFLSMFRNLGVHTQIITTEIFSIKNFKDAKNILFFMFKLTTLIEVAGAIFIYLKIYNLYSFKRAIFLSIFHSVSSFCNAGLSLFPQGMDIIKNSSIMIVSTTFLMFFGGIGFIILYEIIERFKNKKFHFSWNTKLTIKFYLATTVISSILFWIVERNNGLSEISASKQILITLFSGISMKSTGFQLIPFTSVHLATIILAMVIMFIGSAPISTGSGIKMSVFAIYYSVIKAAIQGKQNIILLGRHIIDKQVYKAMSIIALSISWICIITFCLLIVEPTYQFIDILLETVSAFTNNGITTNISPLMGTTGKLFIICTMIIGRIGALAIIMSMKNKINNYEIDYPKEHVIMG